MCQLMSEERSSKTYRNFLHSINPPCIPFLGMISFSVQAYLSLGIYLTDLTMIDTGNPDKLKDRPHLINFHKHFLEAQVIQEIRRYQCSFYSLTKVDVISEWILVRPAKDLQEAYALSLTIEARASASSTVNDLAPSGAGPRRISFLSSRRSSVAPD
jgi:hypothetical protein